MQYVYDFLGYDIKDQLWLLFYALILGAALGVVFDFLRATRVFLGCRDSTLETRTLPEPFVFAVCLIEDIFFSVFAEHADA